MPCMLSALAGVAAKATSVTATTEIALRNRIKTPSLLGFDSSLGCCVMIGTNAQPTQHIACRNARRLVARKACGSKAHRVEEPIAEGVRHGLEGRDAAGARER